jgi:hypothetical protein
MHDDGHFDATIAATYDDPLDLMNQPAAIEPAVEFLASWPLTVGPSSSRSGLGGSACRCAGAASRCMASSFSERHFGIDEYDVVNQGLVSHYFDVRGDEVRRSSGPIRYVWPSKLDLMADMAGLRLRERWSGWQREPFTNVSDKHVSVWEKRSLSAATE